MFCTLVVTAAAQDCQIIDTGSAGTIQTPGYPRRYPSNADCTYRIETSHGDFIKIDFHNFTLEEGNRNGCRYDYFQVFDGNSTGARPLTEPKCGSGSNFTVTSSSNVVLVVFRSDSSISLAGFIASWRRILRCGGNFTGVSGVITSPGYPDNYPNHANCYYNIKTTPGSAIRLSLRILGVESHSSCIYDYVQAYEPRYLPELGRKENAPFTTRACGSESNWPKVTSTSNVVTVYFESDRSVHGRGFILHWERVAAVDSSTNCRDRVSTGCDAGRDNGWCARDSPFHDQMFQHCRRSCGFCITSNNGMAPRPTKDDAGLL